MADESSTALKDELRAGHPKFGVFVNSSSNTVSEMISHLSFDWVLLDTQHGPMNPQRLGTMISAAQSGGVKVFVRVADPRDRNGAQQALDLGADGIMFPTVNNAEEAVQAVSYCRYPTAGTRSVYHPQRSNIKKGLLGYVGNANKNVIVMCQIETKEGIQNVDAIAAVDGVDVLFLGPNDLCMSTGLFEGKYKFPEMYTSPEMKAMEQKLIAAAKRNNKILGVFVFGTDRVPYFLDLGFSLVSVGNDLHMLSSAGEKFLGTLKPLAGSKAGSGKASSGSGSGSGSASHSAADAEDEAWTQFQTAALVVVIAGLVAWLARPGA